MRCSETCVTNLRLATFQQIEDVRLKCIFLQNKLNPKVRKIHPYEALNNAEVLRSGGMVLFTLRHCSGRG
jgi:hypothetical protein